MGVFDARHHCHPARTLSAEPLLTMFPYENETGIAIRLGVTLRTVADWRRGARVRTVTARRVAAQLGSTVADIWFEQRSDVRPVERGA